MEVLQRFTIFVLGYVAGLSSFLMIFLVYLAPISAYTPMPQPAIHQQTGPTYADVCKPDTNNMTDPQIATHAQRWIGQQFNDWRGWIHDVARQADGTYNLEISMYRRGLFWRRDDVAENINNDLATRLNVEQPVVFAGRIARVENTFEVMCNPLVIDDYVLVQ